MSSHTRFAPVQPLDLARWRRVPNVLLAAGGILALIGLLIRPTQFGYSWLLAFMVYLGVMLGAMFLVMMHHLFDAGWSVPIRRFCEHLASLASPTMAFLFLPIAVLAPWLYPWMGVAAPEADPALHAKWPLFTLPSFYLISAL